MDRFKPYATSNREFWRYSFFQGKVLVIEGNIGAGKSSIAKAMENFFNERGISVVYLPEYVDLELLNLFINDMKKYAYIFQLFMLEKRAEIYRQAIEYAKLGYIVIMDRMMYGDYVFALQHYKKGNISEEQFIAYKNRMAHFNFNEPALTFYLDVTPECAYQRAKKRNREGETYDLTYFQEIDQNYKSVIQDYKGEILMIPYEKDLEPENLGQQVETMLNSAIHFLLS